jgi:DNA-binding NtrC family response regulator
VPVGKKYRGGPRPTSKRRIRPHHARPRVRTPRGGLEFLPWLREHHPGVPVLMCSGRSDFDAVREAMREGAWTMSARIAIRITCSAPVGQLLERASEQRQAVLARPGSSGRTATRRSIGASEAALNLREKLDRFEKRCPMS